MARISSRKSREKRSGAAVVELAVMLPFLAFLLVVGVDWCRIFYYTVTLNNCARNGAMYACDPYSLARSPYASITAAALADASNITPAPTVASATGTDANGKAYVECTVSYPYRTLTNFPGVPQSTTITRKVRLFLAPQAPS